MTKTQQVAGVHQDSDIKPLETGTIRLRWASLTMIGLLFFGFGAWMTIAGIEGAVVATGSVVVAGKPKLVQHLDGCVLPPPGDLSPVPHVDEDCMESL